MLDQSAIQPQLIMSEVTYSSNNVKFAPNGGMSSGEQATFSLTRPANPPNDFPPPRDDKPRPHICSMCGRSFARLEHLKRHERSHTKEKPFECPECKRCFARRDLLLRHQQKLHQKASSTARPKNRRGSAASTANPAGGPGSGRVRKNSIANSNTGAASMRPRANTISHVDGAHMQLVAAANAAHAARNNVMPQNQGHQNIHGHSRHPSLADLPMNTYHYGGGMSVAMGQRGMDHGLPKLETHAFNNVDYSGGLRTAPVAGGFNNHNFDFEGYMFTPGPTINPHVLHYIDSPPLMDMDPTSPFHQTFADIPTNHLEDSFDWMNTFDQQISFDQANNENAIDGSSPSAMSTASQSGISEVMLDGSNNPAANCVSMWQSMMAPPLMTPTPFTMELGNSGFSDLMNGGPMSPHSLQKHANDPYFSTPPPSMSSLSPSMMPGLTTQGFQPPLVVGPETPMSMTGSVYGGLPMSTITEGTRQALLATLGQCVSFGARKSSFCSTNSPSPMSSSSPRFANRSNSVSEIPRPLATTPDLQRYVGAYVRYFHPHMPFLHIPTLSFDVPGYITTDRGAAAWIGGRGCLILSMAAIGALYELEHPQSKELFDSAKKMIQLYLEERRKVDVRKAGHRRPSLDYGSRSPENPHTPVWLVQAMLLNVVYGHNCGDKVAGDIASTHCAALVSLARAAELIKPAYSENEPPQQDVRMMDDDDVFTDNAKTEIPDEQQEWYNWKVAEERKRTLYAVFILSSLLVSAYNHTPALTNSEIVSDLPCDEEFWSADSASSFYAKGGVKMADHNQTTFYDALGQLLRTSEKKQFRQAQHQPLSFGSKHSSQDLPPSHLKPSTFGCFILINALHNYIWETRQRHHNKVWTNEETEKMHRHIEPALKAWQSAWASNPQHSLERPNPYGHGPLSADSIPLLDLAYVRLFVNLSKSKEKFWQRDFDGMADELSRGNEIIQHAEHSPSSNADSPVVSETSTSSSVFFDSPPTSNSSPEFNSCRASPNPKQHMSSPSSTKRERHLRKAAFYAADSLSMSDKLGVTFADFTSRELPLQSAMCAFDCAQVLAEWVTTVQERVGRLLGILGRDPIDLDLIPAVMALDEEDCKLLRKIQEVLNSAENKLNVELADLPSVAQASAAQNLTGADSCGYGSKILRITAYMLDKAAVWPVTRLMALSLQTQANHMRARAERSVVRVPVN